MSSSASSASPSRGQPPRRGPGCSPRRDRTVPPSSSSPAATSDGAGGLDAGGSPVDDRLMDGEDEIDRREAERIRRRDRDATAADRALLNPGMGKVFKQIQDAQRKAADEPLPPSARRRRTARPGR